MVLKALFFLNCTHLLFTRGNSLNLNFLQNDNSTNVEFGIKESKNEVLESPMNSGTNDNWSQVTKLVGSDNIGQSEQGNSVSISSDGTTALVGG